jgi:hypothetical protein
MLPCVRSRRSSGSAAQRYWAGRSPMFVKARRRAWISGSSPSVVPASRALATAAITPDLVVVLEAHQLTLPLKAGRLMGPQGNNLYSTV